MSNESYAHLRPVAEAVHASAEAIPRDPNGDPQHQALVTIQVKQAGTLQPPVGTGEQKAMVTPGAYQWILDPTSGWRRYTWNLTPAGGGRSQRVDITFDGTSFHASGEGTELSAVVDQASFFFDWKYERAVRNQLLKPTGPLEESDLNRVTSLALPPNLTSVTELCHFHNLTELVLEQGTAYPQAFLQAALRQVPGLKRLTLADASALVADPGLEPETGFPYRVETPHAVILGDQRMDMATIVRYGYALESKILPELERDTGLQVEQSKPVILIYGDEAEWNADTQNSPYWGYYTARERRIYMAHWRTPDTVNTLLMAHELFHWLAWEEGKVDLPTWLNEGLAHNISWRIEQGASSWLNPFVRKEWLKVAANTSQAVPALDRHTDQDEFTITAVAHLLETRGRDALPPFFKLTRSGTAFADAFRQAFGVTTAEFEGEYRQQVAQLRQGR